MVVVVQDHSLDFEKEQMIALAIILIILALIMCAIISLDNIFGPHDQSVNSPRGSKLSRGGGMADAGVLKTLDRKVVWVRIPLPVPLLMGT